MSKRSFSYEEAVSLLPQVQQLTTDAVARLAELTGQDERGSELVEVTDEYQAVVAEWAEAIIAMGIDVKGLWLIDFDNGSGYYCWRHPEDSLQYFHGYDEGFSGRMKLN